jgi:hypothetical protein
MSHSKSLLDLQEKYETESPIKVDNNEDEDTHL